MCVCVVVVVVVCVCGHSVSVCAEGIFSSLGMRLCIFATYTGIYEGDILLQIMRFVESLEDLTHA